MNLFHLVPLATEEGVPGTHIAADIVPLIGVIIFCGSVYVLVWSIYGAKKGALVYGTAFFSFGMLLGVFWWFGAPGTPSATGLTYFPGQENDRYQAKWFPMEPGSERAEFFPVTNSIENFQTPAEFLGLEGATQEELENEPAYRSLLGSISSGIDSILAAYFPLTGSGAPELGANRREAIFENLTEQIEADEVPAGYVPDQPLLTTRAEPEEDGETPIAYVTQSQGLRVIAVPVQVVATYVNGNPDAPPDPVQVVVEEATWYAFEDPGAMWFPSAVWTGIMGFAFLGCLFGLDRVEQREKRTLEEREPVLA